MNNEIKEILRDLEFASGVFDYTITPDRCTFLKDYITNLQERKITKEDVNKYFKENMCVSFDKFIENWEEQEQITKYLQEENRQTKLLKERYQLEKEYYKSRCEKTIPMLKELNIKIKEILRIGIDIKEISDIENILNGGDQDGR